MKQLDFVDEPPAAAPRSAPEKATRTERLRPPAARPAVRKPAKPARRNRPAGSRDELDLQRLNMEIPRALHKRLKMKAIQDERTVTDLVLQAINEYLARQ